MPKQNTLTKNDFLQASRNNLSYIEALIIQNPHLINDRCSPEFENPLPIRDQLGMLGRHLFWNGTAIVGSVLAGPGAPVVAGGYFYKYYHLLKEEHEATRARARWTLLEYAADTGASLVARFLIEQGADTTDHSFLRIAEKRGYQEFITHCKLSIQKYNESKAKQIELKNERSVLDERDILSRLKVIRKTEKITNLKKYLVKIAQECFYLESENIKLKRDLGLLENDEDVIKTEPHKLDQIDDSQEDSAYINKKLDVIKVIILKSYETVKFVYDMRFHKTSRISEYANKVAKEIYPVYREKYYENMCYIKSLHSHTDQDIQEYAINIYDDLIYTYTTFLHQYYDIVVDLDDLFGSDDDDDEVDYFAPTPKPQASAFTQKPQTNASTPKPQVSISTPKPQASVSTPSSQASASTPKPPASAFTPKPQTSTEKKPSAPEVKPSSASAPPESSKPAVDDSYPHEFIDMKAYYVPGDCFLDAVIALRPPQEWGVLSEKVRQEKQEELKIKLRKEISEELLNKKEDYEFLFEVGDGFVDIVAFDKQLNPIVIKTITYETYEDYCHKVVITPKAYIGLFEIIAFSNIKNIPCLIVNKKTEKCLVLNEESISDDNPPLFLGYENGNHYASLSLPEGKTWKDMVLALADKGDLYLKPETYYRLAKAKELPKFYRDQLSNEEVEKFLTQQQISWSTYFDYSTNRLSLFDSVNIRGLISNGHMNLQNALTFYPGNLEKVAVAMQNPAFQNLIKDSGLHLNLFWGCAHGYLEEGGNQRELLQLCYPDVPALVETGEVTVVEVMSAPGCVFEMLADEGFQQFMERKAISAAMLIKFPFQAIHNLNRKSVRDLVLEDKLTLVQAKRLTDEQLTLIEKGETHKVLPIPAMDEVELPKGPAAPLLFRTPRQVALGRPDYIEEWLNTPFR